MDFEELLLEALAIGDEFDLRLIPQNQTEVVVLESTYEGPDEVDEADSGRCSPVEGMPNLQKVEIELESVEVQGKWYKAAVHFKSHVVYYRPENDFEALARKGQSK